MLRLILWLPFFCLPILAQNVTGSITGAVLDKSGSQIPAVNVKLTSETTAATREAATDPSGNFQFNAIQAGSYTLSVEHPGFKRYEKKNIQLTPNESISLGAIHLDLGDVTDSVVVSADIAMVQIASGERSGIITADEVQNLTVMSRDFAGLVALLPGVVDNASVSEVQGFSGTASFNVAGNRSNGNSITIDGGSTENTNGNSGNNFVSMDSIQTVRIVTSNYQAEFGRKPAASIMAVTKNGTQQYHGA